jgi:hypothetical protein
VSQRGTRHYVMSPDASPDAVQFGQRSTVRARSPSVNPKGGASPNTAPLHESWARPQLALPDPDSSIQIPIPWFRAPKCLQSLAVLHCSRTSDHATVILPNDCVVEEADGGLSALPILGAGSDEACPPSSQATTLLWRFTPKMGLFFSFANCLADYIRCSSSI